MKVYLKKKFLRKALRTAQSVKVYETLYYWFFSEYLLRNKWSLQISYYY